MAFSAASLALRFEPTQDGFATSKSYLQCKMSDRWALVRGGAAGFLALLANLAQKGVGPGGGMAGPGGGVVLVSSGVDSEMVAAGVGAARGVHSSAFM